jgi:alkylation response protein AidB-like acyl-CoA dehydrogenase
MDFDFTDDQEQLRDAVRKFVDKGYTFDRRRSIEAAGGFDRKAYSELADLGLTGLCISSDFDGMGMGPVECMVVQEELGRGLVLEPLAHSYICGPVIENHASPELKKQWLPQIASGQAIVVLAHQERKARYRLDVCDTTATQAGSGYTLNGTKNVVSVGDQADAFLVPAMLGTQMAMFLVERTAAGVATHAYGCQDGSRAADVVLSNAAAHLVTANGLLALELAVDIGIALACAEAVGVMDKSLAITVDYMNTRKQFGATLATFQALRHRVADVKMQLELARGMAYFAALKLGDDVPARRRAMAQAKYQLGQSMRFVGQQAVQLHGGIGVTDEYIVSHYFKKLTQLELSFGDSLHQLGQVSARMQSTAGVFA